ncbi:MAG TPA: family 10 glycosylhydrolase [Myxococcota bacterium]|nr:family 10 glycosylhydrolase [Myxococcota bacterium]
MPAPASPPRRALWVLAEGSQRVLEHPERLPVLLDDARALGATDLFVQVYRGGRAWFDSSHADAAPHRAASERAGGDPLRTLVARAHEAGLRVHAWVNVLSLATNRDAPIAKALGPGAIHVDRRGRSLLDYPKYEVPEPDRGYYRMGTPGLYVDPAAPGVAAELVATFAELCARYPELDGLHLDYIRYPDVLPFAPGTRFGVGLDFGYGASTRERFKTETGREAPLGDGIANADAWDAWRREQVDAIVRETARAARAAQPRIAMSAAVWSYADRAYQVLGQDWRRWLEEGWLDFAVPMAYTRDDRLLRYQAESYAGTPLGARIWPGLGVWLFAKEPERALRQVEIALAAGAPALALFSWDSIAEAPALRAALAADGR